MRIVVDTNVLISDVFFGGIPGKVLKAIIKKDVTACARQRIVEEYNEIVKEQTKKFINSNHFLGDNPNS